MPRFAANLSFLFHEVPFEQRFARAAAAGFAGVEYFLPYALPATRIAGLLEDHGLPPFCAHESVKLGQVASVHLHF